MGLSLLTQLSIDINRLHLALLLCHHREQEQCIGVVEQTLDSLEVEFSKKIDQMKLVIQQLKSVQEQMKQQLTSSSAATETSLSTPGANKRPSTVPVTSTRQVKRPRTT